MFKKIGNFILDIVIGTWLIVAIFVTICLLSYNEFQVTSFGKNTLLIMDSDQMEPDFKEGDLVIVKRNSDNKINVGDKVFYYNSAMDSNVWIYYDTVQDKVQVTKEEATYTINNERVSSEYIIGKADGAKVHHKLGTYLGIFTSRWGFLFLVIFPTLFAIIYEIMMIVDARREMKMERKNEQIDEKQIKQIIADKYNLDNITLSMELLQVDNLERTIGDIKTLINYENLKISGINTNDVDLYIKYSKLVKE